MIEDGIRADINYEIRKYLADRLTGKSYRWKDTNRVMKIYNIMSNDVFLPRFNKEDISLCNFLFRVSEACYDDKCETNNYVIDKWITLPEIYSCGWQESNNDFVNDIFNKAHEILHKNYVTMNNKIYEKILE